MGNSTGTSPQDDWIQASLLDTGQNERSPDRRVAGNEGLTFAAGGERRTVNGERRTVNGER
jgi:hypothetical protein